MPTGNLSTNVDVMSQVSSKFGSDYQHLSDQMKKLHTEATDIAVNWHGAASGAFTTAAQNVDAAWAKLNEVLAEIAGNINTQARNYDNTDVDGASRLKAVPTTDITAGLM